MKYFALACVRALSLSSNFFDWEQYFTHVHLQFQFLKFKKKKSRNWL